MEYIGIPTKASGLSGRAVLHLKIRACSSMVEHLPLKEIVVGPSPTRPSRIKNCPIGAIFNYLELLPVGFGSRTATAGGGVEQKISRFLCVTESFLSSHTALQTACPSVAPTERRRVNFITQNDRIQTY